MSGSHDPSDALCSLSPAHISNQMTDSPWLWVGFNAFILVMLALDLGIFRRNSHVVSLKESLTWTAVWVGLALLFNAGLWYYAGPTKALEFLARWALLMEPPPRIEIEKMPKIPLEKY